MWPGSEAAGFVRWGWDAVDARSGTVSIAWWCPVVSYSLEGR